jgi:hypothetical protein
VCTLRKNRKENAKGSDFCFNAFSKRSRWAEMECHLSLLEQTKIDQAKNDQSLLASCTKTLTKFSKPLGKNFRPGNDSIQVASSFIVVWEQLIVCVQCYVDSCLIVDVTSKRRRHI